MTIDIGPLPGAWVDPKAIADAAWESAGGIVKFFEFPVRIPAMTHRDFHFYWQKHHSPHVLNVTPFAQFMRKYNTGHVFPDPTDALPPRYAQAHPFEGAAEVWLSRWQDVEPWLSHPLYTALIQPDEPRFIAQDGQSAIVVTREEAIHAPDPDLDENGLVKAYLILSRAASIDRPAFHSRLSRHWRDIVARHDLRAKLRKVIVSHRLPDPNPIGGLPPTDIDAVVELWFDDRRALAAFYAADDQHDLAREEARLVDPARSRGLVCRMRVVHDEFSFQPSVTQPLPFTWGE